MRIRKVLWAAGLLVLLSGCADSGLQLSDYQARQPDFALEQFFNGPIKGWGIVQGRDGAVKRSFQVAMTGAWQGSTGTLTEHFIYNDGETQDRVWTIVRQPDGGYQGFAGDVIDKAQAQTAGNALQWNYQMDIKVDDSIYRLTFDDWMFRMDDGVVINRSYLKKFGVTVAELTLFMQKQKP